MRIKYENYECIFIHEKGNRTSCGCSFLAHAFNEFEKDKTAVKMTIFKSTHNNTRLKAYEKVIKKRDGTLTRAKL
jgi:hypothetical protein